MTNLSQSLELDRQLQIAFRIRRHVSTSKCTLYGCRVLLRLQRILEGVHVWHFLGGKSPEVELALGLLPLSQRLTN
jgi:hypothetical protein